MAETWYNHLGLCADYSVANLTLAADIGAQWIRTAPEYGWNIAPSTIKTQTDAIRAKGMKHLVVVQYNAGGTKPHTYDKVLTDPTTRAAFINWIAELAKVTDAVEIGNEWNLTAVFWQGTYDKTWTQQAKLMYDVAVACKKANPNIVPDANHPGWWAVKRNRTVWFGGTASGTSGSWIWPAIAKYGVPIWNTEFGQKRIDFASGAAAATHMGYYFDEYESQKAAGIKVAMHIVISKKAFDGDWTLDFDTKMRIKSQSLKVW